MLENKKKTLTFSLDSTEEAASIPTTGDPATSLHGGRYLLLDTGTPAPDPGGDGEKQRGPGQGETPQGNPGDLLPVSPGTPLQVQLLQAGDQLFPAQEDGVEGTGYLSLPSPA